jgi:hypothetical protein
MFPELRPHLEEAFELAEPGSIHVVTMSRDNGKNLRTQFNRIVRRAGLTAWPKPFQNMWADAGNGTRRVVPDSRRLQVDRQHRAGCRQALPASDRRPLPAGVAARCKKRCTRAAKSDVAGG